jgi:phage I-like protein
MPEEMDNVTPEQPEAPDAPEPEQEQANVDDLPSWAQDMIRGLRSEAAERRVALKKYEEESRKREQERLAEQGKWRELAESRASELSELQPYKDRADTLETMIRDSNKSRIETIPEDMRALVPTDYAPEKLAGWLDANMSRLTKPIAPKLDGGASGGSGSTISLTDEEKQVARSSGMSLEDYAKYKARIFGQS